MDFVYVFIFQQAGGELVLYLTKMICNIPEKQKQFLACVCQFLHSTEYKAERTQNMHVRSKNSLWDSGIMAGKKTQGLSQEA